MTKFEKFYEWLCDWMHRLMIGCLIPAFFFIFKAMFGYALVDAEFYVIIIGMSMAYAVFFLWGICSAIRYTQLNQKEA